MTAAPNLTRVPPDAFQRALAFTLRWEAGKADHPADKGGRTLDGITQATYDTYRRIWKRPKRDVWLMEDEERDRIYRVGYWDAMNGDQLAGVNERMATCVFDTGVNHGVGTASRMFQRTVQAEADGMIGKVTVSCFRLRLMRLGPEQLLTVFLERRAALYKAILLRDKTQWVFRAGWRNRINDLGRYVGLTDPVWEDY